MQKYHKEYAIDYTRENKFKIGDIVWYYDVPYSPNKLGTKWILKVIVIDAKIGSYIIEDCAGTKIRVNVNRLRKV